MVNLLSFKTKRASHFWDKLPPGHGVFFPYCWIPFASVWLMMLHLCPGGTHVHSLLMLSLSGLVTRIAQPHHMGWELFPSFYFLGETV